jgi:ElaB/YqjD/DUF883 family membrane-anchored ribosome-binding protein
MTLCHRVPLAAPHLSDNGEAMASGSGKWRLRASTECVAHPLRCLHRRQRELCRAQFHIRGAPMEDERASTTAGRPVDDRQATSTRSSSFADAREGLEHAGEYITDAVAKTQETVARYRDGGVDMVKKDVAEYTREQPMTALLIATGAGLLLGMLMAVRRR